MKNIKFYTLGFLLTLSFTHLSSQSIEKLSGNIYEFNNQTYIYSNMDSIFAKSPVSNAYFLKAIKQRKKSKAQGYISLGSLGIGLMGTVIFVSNLDGLSNDDSALNAGALMIGFGGLFGAVFGTSGLLKMASAKKNQRLSVSTFNQDYSIILPKKDAIQLNLIGTSNGLGLQLKF